MGPGFTFQNWISQQVGRNDAIGELARKHLLPFRRGRWTRDAIEKRYIQAGKNMHVLRILGDALDEFESLHNHYNKQMESF